MNYLNTPESFRGIISKLEQELKDKIKINTDFKIDTELYRAQHGNIQSRDWLLLNFLPLIIKTVFTNSFHLRNAYTGQFHTYAFVDRDFELEVEDLFFHLIVKFQESIEKYEWNSVFNSWIQLKLKWSCVNYRLKIQKRKEREISIDDIMQDDNDDEEVSIDRVSKLTEEHLLWSNKLTFIQLIEDSNLIKQIDEFIEKKFESKYVIVYNLYFKEGLNILDIAQRFKLKYHSKITHMIKILKENILLHLTQLDPEYCSLYDKYMMQQNGNGHNVDKDADMDCNDLMPKFDTELILSNIQQEISDGVCND
jgi:hypothetical protein